MKYLIPLFKTSSKYLSVFLLLLSLVALNNPFRTIDAAEAYLGDSGFTEVSGDSQGDSTFFENPNNFVGDSTFREVPQFVGDSTFTEIPAPQPPVAPSCEVKRLYPECDPKGPGFVHEVWRESDCSLGIRNIQFQGGVCGDTAAPQPVASCTETKREYPQCGGTVGLESFPKTDTILVTELTNSCTGAKDYWRIPPVNLGNRGECLILQPTPTLAPTVAVVAPTPPVVVQRPPQVPVLDQSCPEGTDFGGVRDSNIICVQQSQNQTQNAQAVANAFTGPITVNVPAGNTSPQIIERVVPVAAKTVVAGNVVELPKTGLPIAAWGLTALAPLGFRLRRFGNSLKKSTSVAQYLWRKREFEKN